LIENGGRLSFICMIPPWKTGTRMIWVLAKTGEFWWVLVCLDANAHWNYLEESYIEDMPCQIAERTDHVRVEGDFRFEHFFFSFCNLKIFFLSGVYG
jgi:hypothetical protein